MGRRFYFGVVFAGCLLLAAFLGVGLANAQRPGGARAASVLLQTGAGTTDPQHAVSDSELTQVPPPARPAVPNAYVEKAPEPVATDRHASASAGGYLYIIGGEMFTGSTYVVTNTLQRFDPLANTWQQLARIPAARDNTEACAMNGYIYVPGGFTSGSTYSNVLYIYSIAGNTWTTGAPVPAANLWPVVACNPSNNKVYVIGGYNGSSAQNTNYIYDVAANTWTLGANIPVATYGSDGGLINGHIYVVGGDLGTATYNYNIATNTWTTAASMTFGCRFGAAGVDSLNRLWIVGGSFCTGSPSTQARTERYDPVANSWTTADSLNEAVYHTNGGFAGSTGLSDFFNVVGGFNGSSIIANTQQLVVTTTTPTPTRTSTSVPTATATSCPIQFADVPSSGSGSTFYSFVRCLACRGVVSGYKCGGAGEPCTNGPDTYYYRPGNNVTRGQLSKIIAGAASLNQVIPAGQRSFHDVLPGDPFYIYIERLSQTGAISGYTCDTINPQTGEYLFCDEASRPWFLPNNNATRGQISKITSIAAGFTEPVPSGQQTFTDVPPSSPFWVYIERLAARGVISGYNDAGHCGAGVPCFRYNDFTTRGQMAKIAANAFFPNCQTPSKPQPVR